MSSIFISYSRPSEHVVKELVQDIEKLGHEVWFDQELSGGQKWWDQILAAIRRCDVFIFVLDQSSLNSVACKSEYSYANELNKPILPILVSDRVSTNLLPPALCEIQFIDYRKRDIGSAFSLARALSSVPSPKALPDPLPPLPNVPISYLSNLTEKVDSTSMLNHEAQSSLVVDIMRGLRDPETKNDAYELLKRLRKRDDLLASVAEDVDLLLTKKVDKTVKFPSGKAPSSVHLYNKASTVARFRDGLITAFIGAVFTGIWQLLLITETVSFTSQVAGGSFVAGTNLITEILIPYMAIAGAVWGVAGFCFPRMREYYAKLVIFFGAILGVILTISFVSGDLEEMITASIVFIFPLGMVLSAAAVYLLDIGKISSTKT